MNKPAPPACRSQGSMLSIIHLCLPPPITIPPFPTVKSAPRSKFLMSALTLSP